MKKRNIIVALLGVMAFGLTTQAQQDEQMSVYMYNPLYFNPAYAGSRDAINVAAVGRFQWINFDGAPRTQWLSVSAPLLFKSLGVGAHLVHDQTGKRQRTAAYADISGSIRVGKKQDRIALGISAGADIVGFDFSDMSVNDPTDPLNGVNISTTKPNIGAGIYYYGAHHYVGLSIPRVFEAKATSGNLVEQLNTRHFFLAAGYVFDLNSVLKLKPSTLIKYTPHAPITFDVDLSLLSYERFWTGLFYRFNESVGASVGFIIKKNYTIGYTYDFPVNGLRTYQGGTHEVFIQLDFNTKKIPYTSPRYF